ncbi:hypothetical protein M8C21_029718, partial [Ambrosia artemisiifolia]
DVAYEHRGQEYSKLREEKKKFEFCTPGVRLNAYKVMQTHTRERMLEMLSRDNDFMDAKLPSTFAYTLSFNVDMYWSCKGNKYFIIKVETLVS